jgi:hypothetical protein
MIFRGAEEPQGNFQWNEDWSFRQLTDGNVSKTITSKEAEESQDRIMTTDE